MLLFILIRPVWKHGPRSLVLVQVFEKLKFLYTGNLDRVYRVIMIVSRAVCYFYPTMIQCYSHSTLIYYERNHKRAFTV